MKKIFLFLVLLLGVTKLSLSQDTVYLAPLDIQFTTGDSGFPQNGDSIYTNSSLIHLTVKVWREHLLQYSVGNDKVSFNDSNGRVQFYPPLAAGERVLIEGSGAATSGGGSSPNPISLNPGSVPTITLPLDSIHLSGTATDSTGTISSWLWTKISGGTATIETPTSAATEVTSLVQGYYVFQLNVTDNHGFKDSATVKDTVNGTTFYDRMLIDLGGHNIGVNNDTAEMTPSNSNPGGSDVNGRHWNNVISDSAAMTLTNDGSSNWVDTAGTTVSGFGLSISERPGGTYGVGQSFNYQGFWQTVGDYPPTAVEDNAFFYPSDVNVWTFTIPSGRTATITFWGDRNVNGSTRRLDFKKSTDSTYTTGYDAGANTSFTNNTSFTGLTGTVQFDIRVHSGDSFGYISVIDIKLH